MCSYFKIYYIIKGIEWIVKHTDNKEGSEHRLTTTYQHKLLLEMEGLRFI